MGNRAQILDQLVVVHANASVGNGECLGLAVHGNGDGQLLVGVDHIVVGQHFKLGAVERIRGIRNQFTQKNFAVGIKGVGENIE